MTNRLMKFFILLFDLTQMHNPEVMMMQKKNLQTSIIAVTLMLVQLGAAEH